MFPGFSKSTKIGVMNLVSLFTIHEGKRKEFLRGCHASIGTPLHLGAPQSYKSLKSTRLSSVKIL